MTRRSHRSDRQSRCSRVAVASLQGLYLGLRCAMGPAAVALAALAFSLPAQALGQDDNLSLTLQSSRQLHDSIAPTVRSSLPVFISGDSITGRPDQDVVIQGRAMLRHGDTVIRGDRLEYDQADDIAKASGAVNVNRSGNVYEGSSLELQLDSFEGSFKAARYRFLKNEAHGEADQVDFLDDSRAVIHNASYTTCQRQPGAAWLPDWILRATSLRIDAQEEVGQAEGAVGAGGAGGGGLAGAGVYVETDGGGGLGVAGDLGACALVARRGRIGA